MSSKIRGLFLVITQ
uniref:Uncharacterized protein n=1 Tax=Rhizophora mucronata TaxID=61149 RepID=A0A2P2QZQ4_RHIMU